MPPLLGGAPSKLSDTLPCNMYAYSVAVTFARCASDAPGAIPHSAPKHDGQLGARARGGGACGSMCKGRHGGVGPCFWHRTVLQRPQPWRSSPRRRCSPRNGTRDAHASCDASFISCDALNAVTKLCCAYLQFRHIHAHAPATPIATARVLKRTPLRSSAKRGCG
jgi:hypothetical protein